MNQNEIPVLPPYVRLSSEEERALARRIAAGDRQARGRLIEANQRLVYSVARRYARLGVPFGDLVQEGMIGLVQAADHFDWRRGARFSTCAMLWIRQAILRALPRLRDTVRVPAHWVRDAGLVREAAEQLTQELQRRPEAGELAARLPQRLRALSDELPIPLQPVSLEQSEEDLRPVLETIADGDAADPQARLLEGFDQGRILAALATLEPRQREVLRLRFGLDGAPERSLTDIARHFGLTRQRVQQLEATALSRLRGELRHEAEVPARQYVG